MWFFFFLMLGPTLKTIKHINVIECFVLNQSDWASTQIWPEQRWTLMDMVSFSHTRLLAIISSSCTQIKNQSAVLIKLGLKSRGCVGVLVVWHPSTSQRCLLLWRGGVQGNRPQSCSVSPAWEQTLEELHRLVVFSHKSKTDQIRSFTLLLDRDTAEAREFCYWQSLS